MNFTDVFCPAASSLATTDRMSSAASAGVAVCAGSKAAEAIKATNVHRCAILAGACCGSPWVMQVSVAIQPPSCNKARNSAIYSRRAYRDCEKGKLLHSLARRFPGIRRLRRSSIARRFLAFRFQQVHASSERKIRRHSSEVAERLVINHAQAFEDENLARHAQAHGGNFPGAVAHIGLLNKEVTAFVEVTENAPAEADIAKQGAVDARDAPSIGVNEKISLHALQHLLDARGRRV